MTLTFTHVLLLLVGGAAAGALNAAAGGGSLILFPALVAVGLPALHANVTNTVALCPGYLGGVLGFRGELSDARERMSQLGGVAVAGSVAGVVALTVAPDSAFDAIVPILLLVASLLVGFDRPLSAWVRRHAAKHPDTDALRVPLLVSVFLAGAYGAYFGGALGIILLATLGILLGDDLRRLNGLKAYLSLLVNVVAALLFVVTAPVHWGAVAIVAPATLIGGRLGAHLSRRVPEVGLRAAVAVTGVVVAVIFVVR